MSGPFASVLDDDPRAVRRLGQSPASGTACAGGFTVFEWRGSVGDYFDVVVPFDADAGEFGITHYASGGIDFVSAADGVWGLANKYHPLGVSLDGRTPLLRRPKGRIRSFLRDDTHRFCVVSADQAGARDGAPMGRRYLYGPTTARIPQHGIFLKIGVAADVLCAQSGDQEVGVAEGECGVVIWKKP